MAFPSQIAKAGSGAQETEGFKCGLVFFLTCDPQTACSVASCSMDGEESLCVGFWSGYHLKETIYGSVAGHFGHFGLDKLGVQGLGVIALLPGSCFWACFVGERIINVLRRMQKQMLILGKQVSLSSPWLSMACLYPSPPPFDSQNISTGAKVLLPGFQSVLYS